MKIKIIKTIIGLLLALSSISEAGTIAGNKSGLETGKTETIRTVSRNVLAAKHSEKPDPELLNLRQNIDELRQEIAKLQSAISDASTIGTLTINDGKDRKDRKNGEQEQEKVRLRGEARKSKENDLRSTLQRVRQQRGRFKAGADSFSESKRNHGQRVAGKVKELEDELESILNGPSDEHFKKLDALREKLEIKRAKPNPETEQTPTISSIVRHR